MRAEKLVLSAAAAADLIAQGLSDDELNILSNFFSVLGSNLALIAAVREAQNDNDTSDTTTEDTNNTNNENNSGDNNNNNKPGNSNTKNIVPSKKNTADKDGTNFSK